MGDGVVFLCMHTHIHTCVCICVYIYTYTCVCVKEHVGHSKFFPVLIMGLILLCLWNKNVAP